MGIICPSKVLGVSASKSGRQQGQTQTHMMITKEAFCMDVNKIVAILVALLEDQEGVKITYEVHKDEKEKTA